MMLKVDLAAVDPYAKLPPPCGLVCARRCTMSNSTSIPLNGIDLGPILGPLYWGKCSDTSCALDCVNILTYIG